jgi:hypothetical protein
MTEPLHSEGSRLAGPNAVERSGDFESPYWPKRGEEHIHPAHRTGSLQSTHSGPSASGGASRPPYKYSLFPKITPLPPSPLTLLSLKPGQRPKVYTGSQREVPNPQAQPTNWEYRGSNKPEHRSTRKILRESLKKAKKTFKRSTPSFTDGFLHPLTFRQSLEEISGPQENTVDEVARELTQPLARGHGATLGYIGRSPSTARAPNMDPSSESCETIQTDYGAATESTIELIRSDPTEINGIVQRSNASNDIGDLNLMIDEVLAMYSDLSLPATGYRGAFTEGAESQRRNFGRNVNVLEPANPEYAPGPSHAAGNPRELVLTAFGNSQRERLYHADTVEHLDPEPQSRYSLSTMPYRSDRHPYARSEHRYSGNPGKIRRYFGFDSKTGPRNQLQEQGMQSGSQPKAVHERLSWRKNSISRRSGEVKRALHRSIGSLRDMIRNA